MTEYYSLIILIIGVVSIVCMIVILRLNAFIALITSAIIVSLLSPGPFIERISRVAFAFGNTAGKIGIVIAFAVIIGKCMMESGAADRIVRGFLSLLGEKRLSFALMSSGFILSIPVFFDTVFYLLIPLARSMYKLTKKNYIKYVLAIGAGGVVTHCLIPPTPGPLVMADNLNIDIGVMILVGIIVSVPTAMIGLAIGWWNNHRMNIPMRPIEGGEEESDPIATENLPRLGISLLPIVLPVILVSANTIFSTIIKNNTESESITSLSNLFKVLGDVNFAMLLSASVAMITLYKKRKLKLKELAQKTESALMSGGLIILITAGGGAFGAMLKQAQIGHAVEQMFSSTSGGSINGIFLMCMGFVIAIILKIAQGSGTVALITASAMISSMMPSIELLGFNPVYLAMAIGGGAMVGVWMNDSGFWIFAKMGGFTEVETLKIWSTLLAAAGFTAFIVSLILANVLPLV